MGACFRGRGIKLPAGRQEGHLAVGVRALGQARVFRQRQQQHFVDALYGLLQLRVEFAHRLDLVAEQLDPHRICRVGRIDVNDAPTNRVLPHHLHRLVAFVADRDQVAFEIFHQQFISRLHPHRQVFDEVRSCDAQQSRTDWRDDDGRGAVHHAPQAHAALLADLGVRREAVVGRHVVGR